MLYALAVGIKNEIISFVFYQLNIDLFFYARFFIYLIEKEFLRLENIISFFILKV